MKTSHQSSADFQVCCIAGFQTCERHEYTEACRLGNRRYSRFGNLRYPLLLQTLSALLLAFATSALAQDKPDLTGKVIDSGLNPLKNATVFVYTAGPRVGTGVICPSCY